MLLLSNSPNYALGQSSLHLKDITVDVTQSNQEVDLSWGDPSSVPMLHLACGGQFTKNMTHCSDKVVPAPRTCAAL